MASVAVAAPGGALAAGPWSDAASLLTARYHHTATLLPSGKVLVVGGTASGGAVAAPELYDPAANTWTSTGGLSSASARYLHTATLLGNGKVLVAGGRSGASALNTTRIYDPATNVWSLGPNMATARYDHIAVLLPTGKVLVAGGYGGGYLASAELYDPAANAWTPAAPLAIGRYQHEGTLLGNGKVLVTGGDTSTTFNVTSAELYDPATNTWANAAAMPAGRSSHTATLLANGKLLVAGGSGSSTFLRTGHVYDPAANTWSATGLLAAGRNEHAATLLATGKVLVTGGFGGSPSFLAAAELYDPATNAWSSAGSLTTPRTQHTSTLLQSGQVIVAGGYGSSSAMASVEAFVTVPGAPTGVSAAAGDASATVSWTAPPTDGGSPVTGYLVTATPGGATALAGAASTSATVSGLVNGTAYTFRVVARNAQGDGPPSAPSNSVTPAAALVSLAVTPAAPSVPWGGSVQLAATGTYSDGSTADLTGSALWSSSDEAVAAVSTAGLAAGLAVGTATISAAVGPVGGSTLLTVTRAAAALALGDLLHTYDGSPKSASVTTTPPGLAGVSVTYDGSPVPPTDAGSYAVVASLDNPDYDAPDAHAVLVIARAAQSILFAALPDRTFGDPDFELSVSASSGLPVSFAAEGACTVSGTTVHLTGAGSCTVTASQAGDRDYEAAADVARTFTVAPPPQTIAERLAALNADVVAATPPVASGLSKELQKKLTEAAKLYSAGKLADACKKLKEFVDKVTAEAKKGAVPAELAAGWIARAQQIRTDIGC